MMDTSSSSEDAGADDSYFLIKRGEDSADDGYFVIKCGEDDAAQVMMVAS